MAATWGGAPSIRGPTDSVRMILLTIWLVAPPADISLDHQMEAILIFQSLTGVQLVWSVEMSC